MPEQSTVPGDEALREAALESLREKRRFHGRLLKALVPLPIVIAVWAVTEYQNAGGWPTGFATGRRNQDWDPWIIYPLIAIGVYAGIGFTRVGTACIASIP